MKVVVAFISSHKIMHHNGCDFFTHQYPTVSKQTWSQSIPSTQSSESAITSLSMARYGPEEEIISLPKRNQLKLEFTSLLHKVIDGKLQEEEYPSLFTQNIEMILAVLGAENGGLLEEIIHEDVMSCNEKQQQQDDSDGKVSEEGSSERLEKISEAVSVLISFVETFVEQTKTMDDVYKQLLGKIFKSISPSGGISTGTTMENELDNLLSSEKEAFTPGFLRHVEGECNRIASLPTISPESAKMLQILRLIQTRVLEELGKV